MKRDLTQLRAALKVFRAKVAAGRDEKLVNLEYRYFFSAEVGEGETEDQIEISEEAFNATPGDETGHPQPGIYEVRATNTETGEVLLTEKGVWQEKKERATEEKKEQSWISEAKTLVGMATSIAESNAFERVRARREVGEAEERARKLQSEKDDLVLAQKGFKDDILQLTKQRDEAYVVRDQALEERDALEAEFDAFKQRGGELRPFAEAAVAKGIDRLAEIFEVHNPAANREAFQECQASVVEDLMARRLSDLISLAHAGEIEWAALRYLIFTYYLVDPGPEPVDPDWQPPGQEQETAAPDAPEEAPPAEEQH